MVNGPAMGLMIVAGVNAFFVIVMLALNLLGMGMAGMGGGMPSDTPDFMAFLASGTYQVISSVIGLAISAFIIYAGMQMRQLQNYGMAMAASIVAIFPCTAPCCIIGMGIGIWALVVLLKPEVKAAFT